MGYCEMIIYNWGGGGVTGVVVCVFVVESLDSLDSFLSFDNFTLLGGCNQSPFFFRFMFNQF